MALVFPLQSQPRRFLIEREGAVPSSPAPVVAEALALWAVLGRQACGRLLWGCCWASVSRQGGRRSCCLEPSSAAEMLDRPSGSWGQDWRLERTPFFAGALPRQVYRHGLHPALLQADAEQAPHPEGPGVHRPRILQLHPLDQVSSPEARLGSCAGGPLGVCRRAEPPSRFALLEGGGQGGWVVPWGSALGVGAV